MCNLAFFVTLFSSKVKLLLSKVSKNQFQEIITDGSSLEKRLKLEDTHKLGKIIETAKSVFELAKEINESFIVFDAFT